MKQHRYLPMTEQDQVDMLQTIGVDTVEELFADIPEAVRFRGELAIPAAKAETSLMKELAGYAENNAHTQHYTSFLGAGVYNHYKPVIVDHVISRSEFYTAYTPYQPEISQGELQAIFEFQTMIAELTAMDLANSSMYDGGTALAEAGMLAAGHTKRKKLLLSQAVHPQYRQVIHTYAVGQSIEVIEIAHENGQTNIEQLIEQLDEQVAAVITQYPNFFGQIEDIEEITQHAHANKALSIVSTNPLALGVLTAPGTFGVDIVTGEAQVFGIPESFGGPHCGFFAVTKALMRKIPGRLVGETVDDEGRRGYVLTLQAREQHIRRDKATSNICSNQALLALASAVAMSAFGKEGMYEIAYQNIAKTYYMKQCLQNANIPIVFDGPHFNEIVIACSTNVDELNEQLIQHGFIGGYHLGKDDARLTNYMLLAVTEIRTKEEIETFVEKLEVLMHAK